MGFPDGFNPDPGQIAGGLVGAATAAATGGLAPVLGGALGAWTAANLEHGQGTWIDRLTDEGKILCAILGWTGGDLCMTALAQAIDGHGDTAALWDALKSDWDNAVNRLDAAESLMGGDYTKAWNLVTNEGENAAAYFGHWPSATDAPPQPWPDPSFDIVALSSSMNAGTTTARDASETAADHGYYAQAAVWRDIARRQLAASPLAALLQAASAKASGDRALMLRIAAELRAAASDSSVASTWSHAGLPAPSLELIPLALGLEAAATPTPPAAPIPTLLPLPPKPPPTLQPLPPPGSYATYDAGGSLVIVTPTPTVLSRIVLWLKGLLP